MDAHEDDVSNAPRFEHVPNLDAGVADDVLGLINMEKVDLPGWRLHDLRRTAASGMARLGVVPHVVEAVLGHRSGVIRGVAAVYNRFNYLAEKESALVGWSLHVVSLASVENGGDEIEKT